MHVGFPARVPWGSCVASLKKLQLRYDPLEVRLALRVSTGDGQEFRFWLTRRYTTLLLAVLDKHQAEDPEVAEHDTAEARRGAACEPSSRRRRVPVPPLVTGSKVLRRGLWAMCLSWRSVWITP